MSPKLSAPVALSVKAVEWSGGLNEIARELAVQAEKFEAAGDYKRAGKTELLSMRLALFALEATEVLSDGE